MQLFVFSLFSSVVSLFWALFGLIELRDFQTSAGEETTLLLIFVAVWLLLAAVILLNMLIGLVTIVFQNIYVRLQSVCLMLKKGV